MSVLALLIAAPLMTSVPTWQTGAAALKAAIIAQDGTPTAHQLPPMSNPPQVSVGTTPPEEQRTFHSWLDQPSPFALWGGEAFADGPFRLAPVMSEGPTHGNVAPGKSATSWRVDEYPGL